MKRKYKSVLLLIASAFMMACQPEPEMVSLGVNDEYAIQRMRILHLHPEYPGDGYEWSMIDSNGCDSVISTERDLFFVKKETGVYRLKLLLTKERHNL